MSDDAADPTEPIEPVDIREVARWDGAADVVVVGGGCAGVCAGIEAAEAGADVVVLEAASGAGGTSAMSGGILYLGGGTPVQQACGWTDTAENMARFLVAACGPGADEAKVRAYAEGSVAHFHWLVEHGVPFEARYYPEHDREPPDDSGLVFSGGEDAWPWNEIAQPAPRGHHPKFPDAAGGFLMQRLLAALDASGARTLTGAAAERLVVDAADGGHVVGVLAAVDGERTALRARRGVVLAMGGFITNRAMVDRYCPVALRCRWPIGTDRDDGLGIRLAAGAGAALVGMDRVEVGIPFTPPRSIVRGVLVNRHGRRFINEDTYAGRLGQEFLLRQGGEVYFVHDDDTFAVNIVGMQAKWVGETADELEAEIGLPAGSLGAALARYNEHAARGEDPDFHKAPEWLQPLSPPYGVVDWRVESALYAPFTLGGVHTDPSGRVLDAAGVPIPGLLAAGRTTAGIAAGGYVSGISLGDGTFFGRAAGRTAAA